MSKVASVPKSVVAKPPSLGKPLSNHEEVLDAISSHEAYEGDGTLASGRDFDTCLNTVIAHARLELEPRQVELQRFERENYTQSPLLGGVYELKLYDGTKAYFKAPHEHTDYPGETFVGELGTYLVAREMGDEFADHVAANIPFVMDGVPGVLTERVYQVHDFPDGSLSTFGDDLWRGENEVALIDYLTQQNDRGGQNIGLGSDGRMMAFDGASAFNNQFEFPDDRVSTEYRITNRKLSDHHREAVERVKESASSGLIGNMLGDCKGEVEAIIERCDEALSWT